MPFRAADQADLPLECTAVLTHHWLVRRRGGEKVLEALAELLPGSPIYTLVHDPTALASSPLAGRRIHTSLLQKLPGATRYYPKLLPLLPWAARQMHLPPVDLVVCSDAAIAKAMTAHPRSKVVCYCHSPMRYVWDLSHEYERAVPELLRPLWPPLCRILRRADRRAARRVDLFVANSRHVAARIKAHYGADSVVVHPPVEVPPTPPNNPRADFYLCVGYHVPYKRLDLAIEACRLLGRKLIVIGDGPDLDRINPRRDAHVQRLGWQPDSVLHDHLGRAAGLLFPGEEDFGLVPVEAIAHGCPVIAYGIGGATETVVPGRTGILFERQTVGSLVEAMEMCAALGFDPQEMHAHARKFDRAHFLANMRRVLTSVIGRAPA